MKLAFLYAGQGSQQAGMGADLYEQFTEFKSAVDMANEHLSFDIKKVMLEGSEGDINETSYTQPCMVAFAIGVTDILKNMGIVPEYAAGLSLGEYSALYAAGVFDGETAIELVAHRGQEMQRAASGDGYAMRAVLGLSRELLKEACDEAAELGVVEISNYNCTGQIVISGEETAVVRAAELAKEKGAKRCMPLKVSGPFHTSFMKPASEKMSEYFTKAQYGKMEIPVLFNCLGDTMGENDTIQNLLERQMYSSVYMEDTILRLEKLGVDTIVEIGPGKVLSGFVKKTAGQIRTFAVQTAEDIKALTLD